MESVVYDDTIVYYNSVGSGLPILFIHPPGLGRRVFDNQKKLSKNYHLLIPDFSGHGNSISPLSDDIVKQYVIEIKQILDKEHIDQVVICAYSAGGTIAQTFVHLFPEKVRGLVIAGAYPKVNSIGLDFMYKFGFYMLNNSPKKLAEILAFSNSRNKVYKDILFHHTMKSTVAHWYAFYEDTYHYDVIHWTDQIECPCLLAYGQRAYWVHKHKKYYQDNPNVKVAFVKNAFHQLPTKNWEAFNHLINQFMRSL
ncbi:AB hydrolase superfamily protein YvaM [Paraliobacillus quinghaiensis]|uniref:AB hydrolase superfamily protein YvaM n=1 Tax=Paraliobacillus quinghaiensis TaxID=470815 RepID=A0A917THJ6_9BACI|nr:alpha/beta hydrolase [Paraliobacillus quinghaiensis]GGM23444.1 AB hydrolase superfamily protein YvaM [Paraliobacillus quinghaiensis]